jgi:hypothetical protein
MPLLVNSVPNLAQGVSQQPDNLRYPGQCDEQVNAWATVVEGLVKRPHTSYIKNVDSSQPTNLFTHFVKRDEKNKYVINVSLGGSVSAYNLSLGTSIPVVTTSIAQSYLSGITNPAKDIRALTVADYTFLVNKSKQVAISNSPDLKSKTIKNDEGKYEALVFVKLGDYEKRYDVILDGKVIEVTHSDTVHAGYTVPSAFLIADHTYQSGSSGSSTGVYADTEYIADHLEKILKTYLTSDKRISSALLTSPGGATPWEYDSGRTELPAYKEGYVNVQYEFSIAQYATNAHTDQIGFGAKGTVIFKNGIVSSSELTHHGTGYNNGLPDDTLKLTIHRHLVFYHYARPWAMRNKGVSYTESYKSNYTTSGSHGTMPTFTNSFLATNYTVKREGAVIKIEGDQDFTIRTEDGLANQGLGVAYKEVDSIVDLPKRCFNGFRVKVRGDADIAQDDYYVRFESKDKEDYGEGSWIETVGWGTDIRAAAELEGIDTTLNNKTMPVTIVPKYNGDGSVNKFLVQTPNELVGTVERNGTVYNLVEEHVSTAATAPGTGADWEEYWVPTTKFTAAPDWEVDKRYNNGLAGYVSRQAGDDFTNPFPSFVGQTINDIFFFKNRLGILTNNAVIFSEADAYFNFFRTTTQQLLDSAPIDVGLSHTKVAVLQHAIPFQEKLMLFSKQSQFVLRGADILSPKTVAISPVTEYDISDSINPLAVGNYIYFTFQRNDYEGVYEYFVDNNTETFNAEEITQQVPKYINKKATRIIGSPTENTLVITTDDDLKTLYVYKYFWSNKEKIQSAWMKFTFARDIIGCDFIDSKLFMLTSDTEGLHLESLTLEDGLTDEGLDYTLYLDSKVDGGLFDGVTYPEPSYNTTTKKTTISNIPYDTTGIQLYTKIGVERPVSIASSSSISIAGTLASYADDGSGSYVAYDGKLYYCVKAHTSTSNFVNINWREVTTVPSGTPDWAAATTYSKGVIYKCLETHTATDDDSPATSAKWAVSTEVSAASIWSSGNFYNNDKYFFLGKPYNMLYRFSNQSLKQPTERGGRSASDYTFQTIRSGSLDYADTGHFTVEVTPLYRDTYKYVFNPDIVGANLSLNEFKPQDGHFRFAVQAQPNEVKIEVKSDSALPVKLLAAEFESMFIPRSKRYGA